MSYQEGYEKSLKTRRKKMAATKKTFLKHLKDGAAIVSYACQMTGIHRSRYYQWLNEDEDFKKECETIQEENVDRAESKLLQAIQDDNLSAIIFYLKTKGKKRGYVETREDNVNIGSFESLMKSLPDEDETE